MKILANFGDYMHTADRRKLNTYGGVGYYRVVKPVQFIEGHEITVIGKEITHFGDTLEEQWDNIFKEYDIYFTNYFADGAAGAAIFYHAQKHGKKVVIDLDDNYLDIPESNLLYDKFKEKKHDRAMLSTILSFADAITVSTEPLKERLQAHIKQVHGIDKPIFVVPNMNDLRDWNYTPAAKDPKKITIGYTGSNSHTDDLMMVMPAIKELMEKYPNLYFDTIGVIEKSKIPLYFKGFNDNCLERCGMLPATSTFKEYPRWLSDQKWDIGIAPLVDTAFTRAKSHIKWLEYSVYKIPTVASRVYPYFYDVAGRETIRDNETGLLTRPNEWVQNLERLILSKSERERIGNNAYNQVKNEWQYTPDVVSSAWDSLIKAIY